MANGDVESRGVKHTNPTFPSYYFEEEGWVSWLIPLFVVVNMLMFLVTMSVNNCPKNTEPFGGQCEGRFLGRISFQPLSETPDWGPSSSTLMKMGALEWNKVVHEHQGWRLITCIWLHAGVIHLFATMSNLLIIGMHLEHQFGFARIGVIYLLSGFGGSILSSLFIRNSISVGASGAIFGILGAALSELLTNWTIYIHKAATLVSQEIIILISVAVGVGVLPYGDKYSHIGGFLTGFMLGFILLVRPLFGWMESQNLQVNSRVTPKYKACQYVLGGIALVLIIVGYTVGLVMLLHGKNG